MNTLRKARKARNLHPLCSMKPKESASDAPTRGTDRGGAWQCRQLLSLGVSDLGFKDLLGVSFFLAKHRSYRCGLSNGNCYIEVFRLYQTPCFDYRKGCHHYGSSSVAVSVAVVLEVIRNCCSRRDD